MKNNTKPATAPKEGAVAKPETNKPATAPKEGAVAETITAEGVNVDTSTGEVIAPSAPKFSALELSQAEEIERLKAQLRKEPQTIEERIAYYHRKEELAEKYKSYNSMIAHIEQLIDKVEEDNADVADFADTRDFYRLRLIAPGYKDETVLSVSNKDLINSILADLKGRMEVKAEQLSKDIAA